MSIRNTAICILILLTLTSESHALPQKTGGDMIRTDVLIIGATPCGIAASISAARCGSDVILTDMGTHLGGMMTSGLGRTDIYPKNSVGGIFKEFVNNVYAYYVDTYGADSQQVKDCNDGYYFEPSVAEKILNRMVKSEKKIKIKYRYRPVGVLKYKNRIHGINFTDKNKKDIQIRAGVFIDATYEGDIAAMSGVPYRVGRESRAEHGEAYNGEIYLDHLTRMVLEGSTGKGDERVQAYNFRLCLTNVRENRLLPDMPENYKREEYLQVIRSIENGRVKRVDDVLNILSIPNGKSDTNNMPLSLISTDLPEENYEYPEATYEERQQIVKRHREYILGLLYFLQNDPEIPRAIRKDCRRWGFAKDEFRDNQNFPRQIYVREARRIWGLYTFTSHDAMLAPGFQRTPIHFDSIACGGYPIDSHATQKKDAKHDTALEGFFWLGGMTRPYQVPYRVMVPQNVDALLVPGAVSATHLGFGTLRMEPVWMAMGQAAGTAAHLARRLHIEPRDVPVNRLQRWLIEQGQVITVFSDLKTPADGLSETALHAMQFYGTRGFFDSYEARPFNPLTRGEAAQWIMSAFKIGDIMTYYGPFVKHQGGGTGLSCLEQLEKLRITETGYDWEFMTEGELASWLSRIRPWIDAAMRDKWTERTIPRESPPTLDDSVIEPDGIVTRAHFCEALYTVYGAYSPLTIQ